MTTPFSTVRFAYLLLFLCLVLATACKPATDRATSMHRYFEEIRNNEALLTAFFSRMPKGGDLHNHFSGSVYGETYWNYLLRKKPWFDTLSLAYEYDSIKSINKKGNYKRYVYIQDIIKKGKLATLKQRILQQWSVKDYVPSDGPSHEHFFDSFGHLPSGGWHETGIGLRELKDRAKTEHVQYLELMLKGIPCGIIPAQADRYEKLLTLHQYSDTIKLKPVLDSILHDLRKQNLFACVTDFNTTLQSIHNEFVPDDDDVTIRYLTYVNRKTDPVKFFTDLLLAFEAAHSNPLIGGVNILSPEHGDVSMRDYRLHMYMFRYCHHVYPTVKYSMHAGELTLGLVKPEDLTFHIRDAVYIAGANRIGHGVDMAYEDNSGELLRYMHDHRVPIEINLWSNEFILNVKNNDHPITLYKQHNVPIVISTDDPGILRSNHVHQFVLLAKRYPEISYADIKTFIFNSIDYSFIKEKETKEKIRASVEAGINTFEEEVLKGKL